MPESPPVTPASESIGSAGDAPLLGLWTECRLALAFLTVLPVRSAEPPPPLAAAVRGFPLVGVVVGLAGAAVYALADLLTLATSISALFAVGAMVLLAGGLHEDGLADTADGLGGGDRETRLAIMRDSRIGTFGVLALVFAVTLRVSAISFAGFADEVALAIIAASAGSRACMPALMYMLPAARGDGLAHDAGRPDRRRVIDAGALGGAAIIGTLGWSAAFAAFTAIAAAALVTFLLGALFRRRFGGYTGDTLGAAQQAAEIAILIAFLVTP
ncbi:MAG TPA: adenosylcobinamide-GDP ribazoletransferase [Alphaproteobacteria bacterium]|nr:adenosylcobinamide-GDP ribazoletransferase [Alphaproteobacteria bacterium]